ncbi:hypothetical protein EXIGLDRAFT_723765 [Exidia glandulosa HHB12029]|uniref:Aprataxin and PNK-like factor PBZ domain-containing protein n=1 Tax=Exidia glandulosa HHB12029 TaxID=1314781 RepID=A0A165EP99_EXIGL|nr:hypothetical protein EXIGLDRAFT_723765 [Exidia glandulosa HHB12029]
MPTLETLPPEIRALILVALDGYTTFKAAVLSCHALHDAFNASKKSILAQFLRNALGGDEVIAAATRTACIEAHLRSRNNIAIDNVPEFMNGIQAFKEDASVSQSPREYEACMARAHVCEELEVAYSRSFKDRKTDERSCLTVAESDRFRMAIHRLFLISIYIQSIVVLPLCLSVATRVPLFYGEFSVQAVFDLLHIVDWMAKTAMECLPPGTAMRRQGTYPLVCLFSGPLRLYNAYMHPGQADAFLRKVDRRVRRQFGAWEQDILHHRQILSRTGVQPEVPQDMSSVVGLAAGPGLECSKCQARPGERIWDQQNWMHVPRNMRLEGLVDWMGYHLAGNYYERDLFLRYLGVEDPHPKQLRIRNARQINVALSPAPDLTIPRILTELLALPHTGNTKEALYLQRDGFNGVTGNDLLCLPCLEDMVGSRLPVWWGSKKLAAVPDEANKPKCLFGMECTEQKIADHAYDHNHACVGNDFGFLDGYKESNKIKGMYTKAGKRR